MNLKLYQLNFQHAHFGLGRLSESVAYFEASRLYSALFLEALKLGVSKEFYQLSLEETFVLSDAFPYINDTPYLPKPIGYPKQVERENINLKQARQEAKKAKKLVYLPFNQFTAFIKRQSSLDTLNQQQKDFSIQDYVMKKGVDPFEVGMTAFNDSLYVIASSSSLFDELFTSLQYSGLGGKRSSGYGQFTLTILDLPIEMQKKIKRQTTQPCMSLTTSLPQESELEKTMTNAAYLLRKASGYVYSEASSEQLRKQDIYRFQAGSTFKQSYAGAIFDVRPDKFLHPVWHYAKGLFYEIDKD